ncbi:MAG: M15 family metallopeptidase [Clostridia bacterium]|nr:M15 family metallopeptidase [Clostridia bacterium]
MSRIISDINELTPLAKKACMLFLKECKNRGLKVRVTETYRTQERQNELYAQGRTAPGKVVTWTKNSRHTSRRAWDICQDIKGKEYDTSGGFFKKCGFVAKEIGITWGGNWKTPDKPHFEVSADWKAPKEEIDMEEVYKLKTEVEALKARLPKIYKKMEDVPGWGKETVEKLVENGILKGDGSNLNLSEDMLRILVIMGR